MNDRKQLSGDPPPGTVAVKLTKKMAYGVGAVSDMIGFHGPTSLVGPIYIIYLGLSPGLVALAIALTRVIDGCLDPVMGNISDNARFRWGKRRPFILVGAILSGAMFAIMGQIPAGMGKESAFAYLLITLVLFYTCYTVFTVPYHALGYEITDDYHERTRVMSFRLFFNTIGGIIAAWLLSLATSSYFETSLSGTAFACCVAGVVFAVLGVVTALALKERSARLDRKEPAVSVGSAVKLVASNKPFLVLLLLASGILVSGTMIMSSFLIYINTYYVFGGSLNKAASFQGVLVIASAVLSLAMIPFATYMSSRIDKVGVMYGAFGVQMLVGILSWFGIQPGAAWPQVLLISIYYASITVFFLMMHSMIGDICDATEIETGARREGMFGAAITWTQKMAVALSTVLSGVILQWVGFKAGQNVVQDQDTLTGMRVAFTCVLIVQPTLSILLLKRYSFNAAAVKILQAKLAAMRNTTSAD